MLAAMGRQYRFRRNRLRFAAITALATLLCCSAQAASDPADIAAARKLGQEGVKLANAGKCPEAIDRLSRAEILHHAPTILGRLGECKIAVGNIVEGTEMLQRVVRETLAPNAPGAFVAARSRAQKVLDAALPKIAHLTIQVRAPRDVNYEVTVNGAAVSKAMLGTARPTDPGEHNVEALAEGFLPARGTIKLAEGQSSTIALSLEPDPSAAKPEPPPKPAPAAEPPRTLHRTLGFVSLGVGGAGLLVGSMFGYLALSKRDQLEASCVNKVCSPQLQGDLDAARTRGNVATAGFVVAGLGLAAGTTLLLWPQAAQLKTSGVTLTPSLGWGNAGLAGTF